MQGHQDYPPALVALRAPMLWEMPPFAPSVSQVIIRVLLARRLVQAVTLVITQMQPGKQAVHLVPLGIISLRLLCHPAVNVLQGIIVHTLEVVHVLYVRLVHIPKLVLLCVSTAPLVHTVPPLVLKAVLGAVVDISSRMLLSRFVVLAQLGSI